MIDTLTQPPMAEQAPGLDAGIAATDFIIEGRMMPRLSDSMRGNVDNAVHLAIDALRQDTYAGADLQTDFSNPLVMTEREAAITAAWNREDSSRHDYKTQAEDTTDGFLGTTSGRIAAGATAAATGLLGGFAMDAAPALAQPNQVAAPPAKTAQPFEFGAKAFSPADSGSAAGAENSIEFSSADISAGDLVKYCAKKELVKPGVAVAKLTAPGKNRQDASVEINYPETPTPPTASVNCRDEVQRNFQFDIVIIKTIREHGKLNREKANLTYFYDSRFTQEEAGTRQTDIAAAGKPQLYECSDGSARTKFFLRNRGTIKDRATGDVVGRKIWKTPFQIVGAVGKHRHVGKRGC